ncbi:MAG: hypothetical protein HY889_03260 [Deltaproteobacteria bacterium]|nr:hypothetical protein [Deltaproteobacteria bacterium]
MRYLIKASGMTLCLLFGLFAPKAHAMDTSGLLSVDDSYYKASDTYVQHLLTTRVRFDLTKLNESGTLAFHFDGRDRVRLGSKTVTSSTKNERIDTLYLENNGKHFYLAAGRLLPKELYVERVDGANAVYQLSVNSGIGLFGGLRPDPYTDAFNSTFTAGGIYGYYRNATVSGNLAYVYNGFKGDVDRQYVYAQTSYNPVQQVSVYATATADINPENKKVKLVNGIMELSWRPDFNTGVTVGVNSFSAIKFYKSMAFAVDDSRQQAYYINANYRIYGRYNVYGRVERQHRHSTVDPGSQNSNSYRAGFNTDNILDSGVAMDLNASTASGYGSKHNTYNAELSRLNWEALQIVLHASYLQNWYGYINSDNIFAYGASGYLYVKRRWSFSLSFDREQGKDTVTSRLMTRISLRF